jgi:hypothetical protein
MPSAGEDDSAQNFRGQPAADLGADHASDQGAGGDQPHHGPVDPAEGEEHVGGSRDEVHGQGQDVLHGIGVLDGPGHEDAEDADQENALGRDKVAAVDAGQIHQEDQDETVAAVPQCVFRVLFAVPDPLLELGLEGHHQQGQHDQHGGGVEEDRVRQVQQQVGPADAAQQRGGQEPQQLPAPALKFLAVAPSSGGASGHEAHGVADGRCDGRVAEGDQHREGDEGARTDNAVDGARPETGDEDEDATEELHALSAPVSGGQWRCNGPQ